MQKVGSSYIFPYMYSNYTGVSPNEMEIEVDRFVYAWSYALCLLDFALPLRLNTVNVVVI